MSSPSSRLPGTAFLEYVRSAEDALAMAAASGEAIRTELKVDARSAIRGFISGVVEFADGSELHFREFVDLDEPWPRRMYAYHYQRADKSLLFRYDDAFHRPSAPSRHHRHSPSGVEASHCPELGEVLDEALTVAAQRKPGLLR